MPLLAPMPPIEIPTDELLGWGQQWVVNNAFGKKEGMDFGKVFDKQIGISLAAMLGDVEIVTPNQKKITPAS